MINLIEELDEAIESSGHLPEDILWMKLDYGNYSTPSITLPPLDGLEGYHLALKLYQGLEYNDSYGTQYLGGIIVFRDGSWLDRWEYDGSEGWDFNRTPSKQFYLDHPDN